MSDTPPSANAVRLETPTGPVWFESSGRLRAYRAEDMAAIIAGERVEALPEPWRYGDDCHRSLAGRLCYQAPWQMEAHKITDTKGWAKLCEPSRLGCQPGCGENCAGCVIRRIRVDHAPRLRGASAFDRQRFRWGQGHAAVVRIGTRGETETDRAGEPPEFSSLPYYRSRWVLLHELAHLAVGPLPGGRSHGHDRAFARKLLELVDWRLGRKVAGAALREGFEHVGIRPFACR